MNNPSYNTYPKAEFSSIDASGVAEDPARIADETSSHGTESSNTVNMDRSKLTNTGEIGYSGTRIYNGFLDSEEYVPDLTGFAFYNTVDKIRNDSIVASIENGFFLPIKQSNMVFNYENKESVNDPKLKMILDDITNQFTNIDKPSFLHQASLIIPYGFMTFELVKELINVNGKPQYKMTKLAPRLPKSIWKWMVDGHGNLEEIIQLVFAFAPDGKSGRWAYIHLPVENTVVITHKKEGGNFTGRSEYRPFYREWKVKDLIFKQSAITIERVGAGVPFALLENDAPEAVDGVNDSAKQQIDAVLEGLQGSESAFASAKYIKDLKFLTIDGNSLEKLQNYMKYCDESIAKSAFQMFMSLGTSNTGSRALGDTFEGLYYNALEAMASEIESAINEQVIKRLIDWNYGEQQVYPKCRLDFQQDVAYIGKTIAEMKRFGVIEGNTDLENFFLEYWGLPLTTQKNRLMPVPSTPAETSGQPASTQPKTTTVTIPNNGQMQKAQMAELNRKPNALEKNIINFSEVSDNLNTLKKSCAMELKNIVQPIMVNMAKELGRGAKIYQVKANFGNKVADVFKKYYKRLLDMGKEDVKKEIIKQDKKLSEKILFATGDISAKLHKEALYGKWYQEEANIDSEELANEVNQAVLDYYKTAVASGLTGDAITQSIIDKIMEEVGQRYDTSADQMTSAYGMVREIGAEEFSDNVQSKIRTEIFDNNLCDVCEEEDGTEYTWDESAQDFLADDGSSAPDLSDPQESQCVGAKYGNPCRGIFLYVV